MATLSELLQAHFASKGTSAREVAIRLGISYPSLLAWASKGGIPRKSEHREMLRRELALPPDEFSRALAASGRDSVDLGGDGPQDLRQLLLRHLAERGLNERSFADLSGIPYAAVIGITQRGQAPRAGMIELLAQHLGIEPDAVRAAAGRAYDGGEAAAGHAAAAAADPAKPVPSLSRLAAERIAASGMSAAAYAHAHGIAYLPLSTLLKTGNPPAQPEVLAALKAALDLDDASFAQSLERTRDTPEPSDPHDALVSAHPLHEAIQRLVRERGWTASAFAEAAGVSQLTAARLVKHGELPARAPTHAKLRQLLGLEQAAYDDLLARSRPAEAPAAVAPEPPPAAAEPEPDPLHPLHAAVRAHVREHGLTQQAFAAKAGLSVLTTAKILKGELPGRGGTHDKLRQALAMDQAAYDDLVGRSGGAAGAEAEPDPEPAPVSAVMDEAQRLARAIVDLRPDQRAAVWKLVTALKRK